MEAFVILEEKKCFKALLKTNMIKLYGNYDYIREAKEPSDIKFGNRDTYKYIWVYKLASFVVILLILLAETSTTVFIRNTARVVESKYAYSVNCDDI